MGEFRGTLSQIYSYPRCFYSPVGELLVVWGYFYFLFAGPFSTPGSDSLEMPGKDLLTGLNSFLPSCLYSQPRGILRANIRSFPLENSKDESHVSHVRLGWGRGEEQFPPSDCEVLREGDVPSLSEWGSWE